MYVCMYVCDFYIYIYIDYMYNIIIYIYNVSDSYCECANISLIIIVFAVNLRS